MSAHKVDVTKDGTRFVNIRIKDCKERAKEGARIGKYLILIGPNHQMREQGSREPRHCEPVGTTTDTTV